MKEKLRKFVTAWKTPILLVVGLLVILPISIKVPDLNLPSILGGLCGFWAGASWLNKKLKKKKEKERNEVNE